MKHLENTHDLAVSSWGPYTKRYMGLSHIPDLNAGLRFDLSIFPGLYRRQVNIPAVRYESGYHPWRAAPDLSYFCHRHEVEWKDRVYSDIEFARDDESSTHFAATCVNQTDSPQNLVLHLMGSLAFPPLGATDDPFKKPVELKLPGGAHWQDALDYRCLTLAASNPRATLTWDGQIRGEARSPDFTRGFALDWSEGEAGDRIEYAFTMPKLHSPALTLRLRAAEGSTVKLSLTGPVITELDIQGTSQFVLVSIPIDPAQSPEGSPVILTLSPEVDSCFTLDGFAVCEESSVTEDCFTDARWQPTPVIEAGPGTNTLLLTYPDLDLIYGLAWEGDVSEVREFNCAELDVFMRDSVHNHVQSTLTGPGEGHFTNVFIRPINLPMKSEQTLHGLVTQGSREDVNAALACWKPGNSEETISRGRARTSDLTPNEAGRAYTFSQERMAATVLTNLVYPTRTQGQWIRHYTPGRWWDSLYTWDSGFIGLGLAELDLDRCRENLNAYLTEPGCKDAAFIHHGSPVPVQFYQFLELFNRTGSVPLATFFYPRLRQYHRFLAGRLGSSTTSSLTSSLLRPWDYFYNSGGWDDYPPQQHVHKNQLTGSVAPVVNTAHAIRTAKILKMVARVLNEDTAEYDDDIERFTQSLQTHSWDEESGYFGYVNHNEAGNPTDILRHASGTNFNMGLGGVSPLIAGICTPDQEEKLSRHLMDDARLWSDCGLSTVDQSAPYYRPDGYWNGAVWMPHQWFMWKALLTMGRGNEAYRIATTALTVWQREVDKSYNCFEHFIVETGRGAGWHHFGGLSSPVLAWYAAYHRPRRLTVGLDTRVVSCSFNPDATELTARLECHGDSARPSTIIITLSDRRTYQVSWNGAPLPATTRHPGTIECSLPGEDGTLKVEAMRLP